MLGMQAFADAIIGVPGQGLNVEQRKLLTIGVELAARPKLRQHPAPSEVPNGC